MELTISDVAFEGVKKPKLHLKRRQVKRIRQKEKELLERIDLLQKNCKALEDVYSKTSKIEFDTSNAERISELWAQQYDVQYYCLYGSYKDFKKAKIKYAENAVKNKDLLCYVKAPFVVFKPISLFSKDGGNFLKNMFMDCFRTKTPAEMELKNIGREIKKNQMMQEVLNRK